jgi:hypothetical protein
VAKYADPANLVYLMNDARIYYRGAAAWVAGSDPWAAAAPLPGFPGHFAALPSTVVVLAPFTLLGENGFLVLAGIATAAGMVAIVRGCGLPWTWLGFPPLLDGALSGNPNIALVGAIVAGVPVIAPVVKVYFFLPLLERPRALVGAALVCLATVAVAPGLWWSWASRFGEISARLSADFYGGWSAWGHPPLMLVAVISLGVLLVLDRRAALWLAVPTLWPVTGFHYNVMAMPAVPWAALLLYAVPEPQLVVGATAAVAVWRTYERVRATSRRAASGSAGSPPLPTATRPAPGSS